MSDPERYFPWLGSGPEGHPEAGMMPDKKGEYVTAEDYFNMREELRGELCRAGVRIRGNIQPLLNEKDARIASLEAKLASSNEQTELVYQSLSVRDQELANAEARVKELEGQLDKVLIWNMELVAECKRFYGLFDDVSTYADMFKPEHTGYYHAVNEAASTALNEGIFYSDGYEILIKKKEDRK